MFIYSTLTDKHYSGDTKLAWQQGQFDKRITFSGEEYMRKQPDIYVQLSEHRAAEELYRWLHNTVDKTNSGCSNPDMFCQIFSEYVSDGFLPEKSFKKYGGNDYTTRLMAKVRENRTLVENINKAVAAGAIRTVDGFQSDE
jgi:hypothetical protein